MQYCERPAFLATVCNSVGERGPAKKFGRGSSVKKVLARERPNLDADLELLALLVPAASTQPHVLVGATALREQHERQENFQCFAKGDGIGMYSCAVATQIGRYQKLGVLFTSHLCL